MGCSIIKYPNKFGVFDLKLVGSIRRFYFYFVCVILNAGFSVFKLPNKSGCLIRCLINETPHYCNTFNKGPGSASYLASFHPFIHLFMISTIREMDPLKWTQEQKEKRMNVIKTYFLMGNPKHLGESFFNTWVKLSSQTLAWFVSHSKDYTLLIFAFCIPFLSPCCKP